MSSTTRRKPEILLPCLFVCKLLLLKPGAAIAQSVSDQLLAGPSRNRGSILGSGNRFVVPLK
jgi:hypothetical protein